MGMDMSGPAGIPLAQGEDDRDGLEMDALHVSLGPILPAWPADLVLRCTLHGDMIAAADAELLPAPTAPSPSVPDERGALLVDAAARTVELAGWAPVAIALRRVRDDLLLPPSSDREQTVARLRRLTRHIRRSRTLRWSLRGVRPAFDEAATAGPDVHELLLALLDHASHAVGGDASAGNEPVRTADPDDLARAVVGQDLATARLIVASLTPWGSVERHSVGRPMGAGGGC